MKSKSKHAQKPLPFVNIQNLLPRLEQLLYVSFSIPNFRTVKMAAADIECGFCWTKGVRLVDPRLLPCTHVHCHVCLTEHYAANGIIRCPICR